jgi:predicted transcriptional regulator
VTRRIKRSQLELFHDILESVQKESSYDKALPTRVQQSSNLSYDKFSKYLDELKNRNLVTQDSPLNITEKGKQFLQDYGKIKNFLTKMKLEYLNEGEKANER